MTSVAFARRSAAAQQSHASRLVRSQQPDSYTMTSTPIRIISAAFHLACVLTAISACAINTESESRVATAPPRLVECVPAFAGRCSENSLHRQLPELMTPSYGADADLQPPNSSPYRKLEVLPQLKIVPASPPNADNILLDRRPGDPG
jgi:hypothetical protein